MHCMISIYNYTSTRLETLLIGSETSLKKERINVLGDLRLGNPDVVDGMRVFSALARRWYSLR